MPRARLYRPTAANLRRLALQLRSGELVAAPTETVYGLAGNALDPAACRKIFRAKGRPTTDPLIVHVHTWDQLDALAHTNPAALRLARAFWPGPLTVILPRKPIVPDLVTAGKPSVAIRMPEHRVFRRLLKLAGVPLAAPSANPFGYVSPTTAQHVRDGLGTRIKHILDGGAARVGIESTIVDLRDPDCPRLLRPGGVPEAAIERVLKRPLLRQAGGPPRANEAQLAPGMLKRHYSPRTPVSLHARLEPPFREHEAYVFVKRPRGRMPKNVFWLDPRGDLRGAARRLFALLRELDRAAFRRLHFELAPPGDLAAAINDRLQRAAAR